MKRAICTAINSMKEDDKRVRVLLIATSGYYEPTVVMEASK